MSARILIVDDEEGLREFLCDALESEGHVVDAAADGKQAISQLRASGFDLVVTDLKMPHCDGIELLGWLREEQPDVEVILLTAHGTVATAVEAMKRGAFDYLQKPLKSPAELRLVASRALERRRLKTLVDGAQRDKGLQDEIVLTWGAPTMSSVVTALRKVAATQATVLIVGESGTGKEVAARAVHRWSNRAEGPFCAVNCAALTESLLESELFGHEKGAFTGAAAQRRGRIELAQGGTFFLDEVGELKPTMQAKLLRVLQERQFERVGGSRTLTADVRWVAATNRDLGRQMADGLFREDLYHRLAVFPVQLPPLRERGEDIEPLCHELLRVIAREIGKAPLEISPDALKQIVAAPWPGNIRQLRNALERAAIVVEGTIIGREHVYFDPALSSAHLPEGTAAATTLADLERRAIEDALGNCGGNRKHAAEQLGIGERTLYEKLKKYGTRSP